MVACMCVCVCVCVCVSVDEKKGSAGDAPLVPSSPVLMILAFGKQTGRQVGAQTHSTNAVRVSLVLVLALL